MEAALHQLSDAVALIVEAAAVAVAAWGALEAAWRILPVVLRPTIGVRKEIWRRFGVWLLLALEFELAADIIRSVVAPTWQDIGELGAIAVIRTFLNYFLEKDLEHASSAERSYA